MLYSYLSFTLKKSFNLKKIEKILLFKSTSAFYYCNKYKKSYRNNYYHFKKPFITKKLFRSKSFNLSHHTKKKIFIRHVRYSFFSNFFYSIFHKRFS